MFKNLIGGEWVEGPRVSRNINPSDTRDVVGEFAQADPTQPKPGMPSPQPPRPAASTTSDGKTLMVTFDKAVIDNNMPAGDAVPLTVTANFLTGGVQKQLSSTTTLRVVN